MFTGMYICLFVCFTCHCIYRQINDAFIASYHASYGATPATEGTAPPTEMTSSSSRQPLPRGGDDESPQKGESSKGGKGETEVSAPAICNIITSLFYNYGGILLINNYLLAK